MVTFQVPALQVVWHMHGRVGDSPVIGAGLYVDNEYGAAVCTGLGEVVLKNLSSFLAVELMRNKKSPQKACEIAIERLLAKTPNYKDLQVGMIAINKKGETGAYAIHPNFTYAKTSNTINKVFEAAHKILESNKNIKIDLIIVGQACLDNIQFEDILKNLKSLKQESHVLLIPEIINSKTAKGLFSNKLVDGIISRNCSLNDFRIAIETLTKGDVYIGPDISLHQSNEMTVQVTKKDNPYYLLQKLTIQEKKIMELVIEGKSSTDIAQLLFRSVHTIKTHRKNMLHKLGVSNTIELISFLDSVDYNK